MRKTSKGHWLFGLVSVMKALAGLIAATTALHLALSTPPRDSYSRPQSDGGAGHALSQPVSNK